MKKSILILAAFAFVAFSCTKTEVKDDTPKKGINFSAYTAKPTKAAQTDVKTDNLTQFKVTATGNGATYFDDISFAKNASSIWVSNPEYFWPAYPLNFYAYNTPEKGTFSRDLTDIVNSGPKLKFKTSLVLAEQEDLVAAKASSSAITGPLDITFNHYLTQVIVKAKCSNSNYVVKVDGVKIANMAGEGTYTFSDSKMTATDGTINTAASSDYSASFDGKTLTSTPELVMPDNGKWYLIPQSVRAWKQGKDVDDPDLKNNNTENGTANGTYLALKVLISTKAGAQIYPKTGSETAWMAVPVPAAQEFAQGKRYTIILDFFGNNGAGYVDPEVPGELDGDNQTDDSGKPIVGSEIKFNATVETWDDNDVTITISL